MNRLILAAVLMLVCSSFAEARCHRQGGLFHSRTVTRTHTTAPAAVVVPAAPAPAPKTAAPAPTAAPVVTASGCASGSCSSGRTVTRSRFHFFSR